MNNKVKIIETQILSDNFFTLKNVTFELENENGKIEQAREVYHTANGATVLLYNNDKGTIILIRQFRFATVLNGNLNGDLIEACAGIIEDEAPDESIKREIEEETGYKLADVTKVFELYSSPGATTEKLFYYVARYSEKEKVSEGGGLESEHENIEVIEMPFEEAWTKMQTGQICDAKTIILLLYARIHLFTEEKVFNIL
jgi:GDP-mannose pyrophosphatase NudK